MKHPFHSPSEDEFNGLVWGDRNFRDETGIIEGKSHSFGHTLAGCFHPSKRPMIWKGLWSAVCKEIPYLGCLVATERAGCPRIGFQGV